MALLLARSSIVPENYRGEEHVGDCMIALEIASRIGAPVLAVMQNLQPVRGRPGWTSQFLISCVNVSRRFSPLRYEMTGTRGTDSWGCIAWALEKTGERLQSPEVTIKIAKAEGWYYRPGSKWRTLPELMLRYRSATLFTRLHAPELTMGLQTTEEVVDLAEINVLGTRPSFETEPAKPAAGSGCKPEHSLAIPTVSAALTSVDATEEAATPPPAAHQVTTGHYQHLKALNGLIGLSPHTEADVLTYLRQKARCDSSRVSLAEVARQQPEVIVWTHDHWHELELELTRSRKGRSP